VHAQQNTHPLKQPNYSVIVGPYNQKTTAKQHNQQISHICLELKLG